LASPFIEMLLTPIAAASLLAVLGTQPVGVLAQDADGWYKAHPGMARISQVNQDTHQIVDEFGRTRFFHGTNVVMKEPPWYRPLEWVPGVSSFGEQDVQNLHDLGVNIVRLGHSWAGAEPVRGQYNQTFLDIMKKQTKVAEDHGLYVLVDVHQDVLARQLCGHGVPDVSRCMAMLAQLILTRLHSGLLRRTGYQAGRCILFLSS
jgi:endoglycosylceramidase